MKEIPSDDEKLLINRKLKRHNIMPKMKASTVHIFIMGFTESTERITGIEEIWHSLRHFSSPLEWVMSPLVWNSNWKSTAQFISRNLAEDPLVYIYAYSWGAGHGFPTLAKELGHLGIKITGAALADPVYRSKLTVMKWRSLINRGPLAPKITIPISVTEVYQVIQKQNKPQAHALIDNAFTNIHSPLVVKYNHGSVDNSPEFKNICLNLIKKKA